ncbi:pentapeptide repeat-containing protein [Candidatus Pacearchaeota archaeon]|nr:pentapeptide repeat-containing protein [Candidatus Pacearchaeota archaeon]
MVKKETLTRILTSERPISRGYSKLSKVEAFNRARKQRWAEDFLGTDLFIGSGMNLPGINLENVNLGSANLRQTNFEGANLKGVIFDYTHVDGAIFRNADLRDCRRLYKVVANGADFENADLRGASFRPYPEDKDYDRIMKGLLQDANFSGTKITAEQREQLINWFRLSEQDVESHFVVKPRGRYRHPYDYSYEKGLQEHEKAEREGRIFSEQFNGSTLEYALVPVQGNEDIRDHAGYAFALCRSCPDLMQLLGSNEARYRGKWLYFVFEDVPEEFREFAAVHEFGERAGGNHKEATIIEYERARSRGTLDEYLSWLVATYPTRLIYDALHFSNGGAERLPNEVIQATRKVMPRSASAWKKEQEIYRREGLPFDVWKLAWRGLTSEEIVQGLHKKGYDADANTVEYWREQMEIPDHRAIQRLTYLEPLR